MTQTILVVEDEPGVLLFLEEVLDERGFAVISARSGGEALSVLGSCLHDIHALVADIRIGEGLSGWDIAHCARDVIPDLPIVYITDDSAADWDEHGVPHSRLLQKPFTQTDLAEALDDMLATA